MHDNLVELLGTTVEPLNLNVTPPAVIMMLGLQGSGKTTTSAKLAKYLTEKERKKVLLVSLDVCRPAAQEQLAVLGEQIGVASLPVVAGQAPVAITKRAFRKCLVENSDLAACRGRHDRSGRREYGNAI